MNDPKRPDLPKPGQPLKGAPERKNDPFREIPLSVPQHRPHYPPSGYPDRPPGPKK